MNEITAISTLLGSIKTATEIAKFIKNSDTSIESAETKLKIAELISTLADVKFELADVQDLLRERDNKIRILEDKLKSRKSLSFDGKLYWQVDDETPFCAVCYERDEKHHHLTYSEAGGFYSSASYYCNVCTNTYFPK